MTTNFHTYVAVVALSMAIMTVSCQMSAHHEDTEALSEYLARRFQMEIPSARSYFLVLNGLGCSLCSDELTKSFMSLSSERADIFLVTNNEIYAERLKGNPALGRRMLFDDTPELSRLGFGAGGTTLLVTIGGQIQEKIQFTPENVHRFRSFVNADSAGAK